MHVYYTEHSHKILNLEILNGFSVCITPQKHLNISMTYKTVMCNNGQ
jgi:hypothetical protein